MGRRGSRKESGFSAPTIFLMLVVVLAAQLSFGFEGSVLVVALMSILLFFTIANDD
jgi:hypothetical protein